MQKARQNRRLKWALEDLINVIAGCKNMGWQRADLDTIEHYNRDRPGGHQHTALKIKCVENYWTDEVGTARRKTIKKSNRRLQRRNAKTTIAEALFDYMKSVQDDLDIYDPTQDLFDKMDREEQRQLLSEYISNYYMEDYIQDMDLDDQLYDDILSDFYDDYDLEYVL